MQLQLWCPKRHPMGMGGVADMVAAEAPQSVMLMYSLDIIIARLEVLMLKPTYRQMDLELAGREQKEEMEATELLSFITQSRNQTLPAPS